MKSVIVCGFALGITASTAEVFLGDVFYPAPGGIASADLVRASEVYASGLGEPFVSGAGGDIARVKPGRSVIHADSTYFLAQALGYRADVAYWIAAFDEVTDYP